MNLTIGELALLAEHLDIDPSLTLGNRSDDELLNLRAEGFRSLVARGFISFEGDEVVVMSGLAELGAAALVPERLVTYTRVVGEAAELLNLFVSSGQAVSGVPVADGVIRYSTIDSDAVIRIITGEAPGGSVHRIEVAEGGAGAAMMAWAVSDDGTISVAAAEGATEFAKDELVDTLTALVFGTDDQES